MKKICFAFEDSMQSLIHFWMFSCKIFELSCGYECIQSQKTKFLAAKHTAMEKHVVL